VFCDTITVKKKLIKKQFYKEKFNLHNKLYANE
jgi:hypothetical protein